MSTEVSYSIVDQQANVMKTTPAPQINALELSSTHHNTQTKMATSSSSLPPTSRRTPVSPSSSPRPSSRLYPTDERGNYLPPAVGGGGGPRPASRGTPTGFYAAATAAVVAAVTAGDDHNSSSSRTHSPSSRSNTAHNGRSASAGLANAAATTPSQQQHDVTLYKSPRHTSIAPRHTLADADCGGEGDDGEYDTHNPEEPSKRPVALSSGALASEALPIASHHDRSPSSQQQQQQQQRPYSSSLKDVSEWIAGSKYMHYSIERSTNSRTGNSPSPPHVAPKTSTTTASGRVGGGEANSSETVTLAVDPSGGVRVVSSPSHPSSSSPSPKYNDFVTSLSSSVGGVSVVNHSYQYNIGHGITISASPNKTKHQHEEHHEEKAGQTSARLPTVGAQKQNTSQQSSSSPLLSPAPPLPPPNISTKNRDMDEAAARARLLQRRNELQASLDARGSTYKSKLGKMTSAWMVSAGMANGGRDENGKRCHRKAATPPRQPSPKKQSDAGGSSQQQQHASLNSTSPNRGDTVSDFSLNSTAKKKHKEVDEEEDGDRPLTPSVIRQHLAASFAAVHLSPNSTTAIVYSPKVSPRVSNGGGASNKSGSGESSLNNTLASHKGGEESMANTTRTEASAASSLGGSALSSSAKQRAKAKAVEAALANDYYHQHGYIKGMDIGIKPPEVALKRSTSPPLKPIHGGATHTEQQQPHLFPALLGPFTNPDYYCRRDAPTVHQLQEQRDHRPVSPSRFGNPMGIPMEERKYAPDHDVELDSPIRLCGSESFKPMPRVRPAAGPPQFYSPGTTKAAMRTYLNSQAHK